MRKDLDKNDSVNCLVTSEVEDVIKEIIFAFPYIWASVSVSIDGS